MAPQSHLFSGPLLSPQVPEGCLVVGPSHLALAVAAWDWKQLSDSEAVTPSRAALSRYNAGDGVPSRLSDGGETAGAKEPCTAITVPPLPRVEQGEKSAHTGNVISKPRAWPVV